ncbi:MAG: hypothetical protein WC272_06555 [Sulfurimonas sp.]|jgi:hypothetical protein
MYDEKNLIHIFTILECCEKAWIYTKDFDNPADFIWANVMVNFINPQKELLKEFLNTPYYKHIGYLA